MCQNSIIILGTFSNKLLLVFIRFVDISVDVRVECIKRAKEFLQHHPVLASDLAGRCCIKFIEIIWSDSPIPVHLFAYCLLLFKNKTLIRIPPIHNNIMLISGWVFCNLAKNLIALLAVDF